MASQEMQAAYSVCEHLLHVFALHIVPAVQRSGVSRDWVLGLGLRIQGLGLTDSGFRAYLRACGLGLRELRFLCRVILV